MTRLLPGGTPRSDDDHAPNGQGEPPALHPLTGTFADPKQEESFGAWAFRAAFKFHVVLLVLMIGLTVEFNGATGNRGSGFDVAAWRLGSARAWASTISKTRWTRSAWVRQRGRSSWLFLS